MSVHYVNDSRFDPIVSIETTAQCVGIACTRYRERAGEFAPKTNRTHDALRRFVGAGARLAAPIAQSHRR
jgi:hypothetical protein